MKKKSITAAEFDEKFEVNGNLNEFLDLENGTRPGQKPRRVSVDFPEWMVQELDKVARNLGITRQSVIKVFISDKLKKTV